MVIYMGIEKKTVCTRLNDEMKNALEKIAKRENRTISNLLETIVIEYLRKKQDGTSDE